MEATTRRRSLQERFESTPLGRIVISIFLLVRFVAPIRVGFYHVDDLVRVPPERMDAILLAVRRRFSGSSVTVSPGVASRSGSG
jgi:hypothetical protein